MEYIRYSYDARTLNDCKVVQNLKNKDLSLGRKFLSIILFVLSPGQIIQFAYVLLHVYKAEERKDYLAMFSFGLFKIQIYFYEILCWIPIALFGLFFWPAYSFFSELFDSDFLGPY